MSRTANEAVVTDKMMTLIWGLPKCGKNTFVLGNVNAGVAPWPLPIHLINFDWGTDEILPMVDPKIKDRIIIHDIRGAKPQTDTGVAKTNLKEFYDALAEADESIVASGNGTICVDTSTRLWELIQIVDLEDIIKVRKAQNRDLYPYDYGTANERYRSLMYWMKERANVALLAHAQEVWDSKGPTGEIRPHVNKRTRAIVQEEVHLERREVLYVGKPPQISFQGTVVFSRHNMQAAGIPIPSLDYPQLYSMLFGREPK